MDQKKIGSFIAARRKDNGLTQSQLAEILGITDKAVSKWETGKSLPDPSLFCPLCDLLHITLNELLSGEFISDENLKEKSNQILLEVVTSWLGTDQWENKADTHASTVLKIKNVRKVYETESTAIKAVKDVSFEITKGSFVGIMGASGSGKTTLLNMIATIDKATSGQIEIDGYDIAELLADEPTGALDSHSAAQLLETFVMLCQKYTATILMVTHDALSASYCDRLLFI